MNKSRAGSGAKFSLNEGVQHYIVTAAFSRGNIFDTSYFEHQRKCIK